MKKFIGSCILFAIQGAAIGIVVIVAAFLTVESVSDYEPPVFVREIPVQDIRIVGAGEGASGAKEIVVNGKLINPDREFKEQIYCDIEFLDKEGNFIYGDTRTSLDFIGPKEIENFSLRVWLPNVVETENIETVHLNVYEMKF
ncbi:MAG: hypothetical protein AB3N10_19400 [Allomuricauda sp.]